MIKLKSFITGIGLGAIAGAAISFMTDKETGQPIKKEVKTLVNETNSDVKNITLNVQRAQNDLEELQKQDIPLVKRQISSIERSLKEFQYNTKPTLDNIQTALNKLSSDAKNLK